MSYTQMQKAMASGYGYSTCWMRRWTSSDKPGAKPVPRLRGKVEFRDLSFSYVDGEDVLKKVNLHVNAGETVAVVGPTGAGKTTLVSLMSRFYDIPRDSGAILVDGYDIRRRDQGVGGPADEHGPSGAISLLGHSQGKHQIQPSRGHGRRDDRSRQGCGRP